MAIKRLTPIQDTYIVRNSDDASFGADEILELGVNPRLGSEGCSRILLEFMTNEAEELLGNYPLSRAILHLKYATSENLLPVWGTACTEINTEWAEGTGHAYDLPGYKEGASWTKPKGLSKPDVWDGGIVEGAEYEWVRDAYTGYQLKRDLEIDVTKWVYQWFLQPRTHRGLGFLIKLDNEELAEKVGMRICFYSSETHTIYKPYLELVFDDSICTVDDPETADASSVVIFPKNLKESYYRGDKVRVDLGVRPEYPRRTFVTDSIYRDTGVRVPNLLWGIRDEYTGELSVPFNPVGTKCSYDENGNFMVLDTDLLEPERYYRLLFEVETETDRKVFDGKDLFRVTRYGEL